MKLEFLETTRVSITSVRIMVQVLEEEGLCVDALFAQSDLTPNAVADPNLTISGLKELGFQTRFIQQTGYRPDIWARLGTRYRWLHYGIGGLAAATATNLHQLMHTFSSWSHMTYSLASPVPLWDKDENMIIGLEFDLTEVPESLRAFTLFRDMGASTALIAGVLAVDQPVLAFNCALPDPKLSGLKEALNAKALDFGTLSSNCFWDKVYAKSTLPNSEPLLHQGYLEKCRENEQLVSMTGGFLQSVVAVLQGSPDAVTIHDLANALGMSTRTLQRRINEHGMTFHDLRGTVLARQACDMLRNSNRSIAEIGWAIGYSEPTGFTQAFRRWTGLSPSAYRSGRKAPSEVF